MERVIPEAVSEMSGGIKQIDEMVLTAALINSVKELHAEIDSLQNKVMHLETKMKRRNFNE